MTQAKQIESLRYNEFGGAIGLSRRAINPPLGIHARSWGSSTHDIADGLHKSLFATCVAFASDKRARPVFLLALDLSFWRSRQEEEELRHPLLAAMDVRPDELILHLSHTHGAPSTTMEQAERPGGKFIAEYRDQIRDTCQEVMAEAAADMRPSTLTWATGSCGLAYNRDLVLPDSGEILCGLNPARDADDTLLVGRITGRTGEIRGVLVNYACHPTSLGGANRYISPDYVGALREIVEKESAGALCVFLHGADGDLTPRRSYEEDVSVADNNGREVGYAALSVLCSMVPPGTELAFEGREESGTALARWTLREKIVSAALDVRRATVSLAVADLPSTRELQESLRACADRNDYNRERLERRLYLRMSLGDGDEVDFSFVVWRLGASIVVATPSEPYSAFQMELRRRFPGLDIAVLNISNGYLSYLPSREAYKTDTYPVRVALFEAGCMEKVLDAAATTISELMS